MIRKAIAVVLIFAVITALSLTAGNMYAAPETEKVKYRSESLDLTTELEADWEHNEKVTQENAVVLTSEGALWAALPVDGKEGNPAIGDEVYMEAEVCIDPAIEGAGNGEPFLRIQASGKEDLAWLNDLQEFERGKPVIAKSKLKDNQGKIAPGTTQLWLNVYNLQGKGTVEVKNIKAYGIRNGKRVDYVVPNGDFSKPISKGRDWDYIHAGIQRTIVLQPGGTAGCSLELGTSNDSPHSGDKVSFQLEVFSGEGVKAEDTLFAGVSDETGGLAGIRCADIRETGIWSVVTSNALEREGKIDDTSTGILFELQNPTRDTIKIKGIELFGERSKSTYTGAATRKKSAGPAYITRKPVKQTNIERIEMMPNIPPQFKMRDWKNVAEGFDKLVFDFDIKGEHLPIIWWDKTHRNFDQDTFGLPAYVGDNRQKEGENHEGITAMSAVLGATLVGIDKSNQNGYNFVKMCQNYYNKDNGERLVLDLTSTDTGHTFWYEVYPGVLFTSLASCYPNVENMDEIMLDTANRWYEAAYEMGGKTGEPNFDYNSFDFDTMKPVEDLWSEPDSAAGIGWIQYMAYMKTKDSKFLDAADWGMQFLQSREYSPYYEILLPFGAYLAARMNAEQDRNYDVKKLVNWCFDIDPMSARPGIGVAAGKWGETNVDGLYHVYGDRQFYAFTMNTFSMASPLVPMVRYDPGFARAIGKWMLNAANNARLFYGDAWPEDQQSSAFWKDDPDHVIAYEGLNQNWMGKTPYAMGDPLRWGWGETDFGIYGSTHVGIFGGLISRTSDEKILRLDCLKTDFFHDQAYPTYLYYNPYHSARTVEVDVGPEAVNIYDVVTKQFIASNVKGKAKIRLLPDSAAVAVTTPVGGSIEIKDGKMLVNGVIVDYRVK